jgi:IPT/TIG domain
VIGWPGMTNRTGYSVDTVFNSAARRGVFVIEAVLWGAAVSLALAACGQNTPRIPSAIQGSTLAVQASTSPAHRGTPAAHGSTSAPVSSTGGGGTSTACPTQGVGGDSLPPLCAPATSPSSQLGITPPATETPPTTTQAVSVISVSPSQGSETGGDTVIINGTGFCSDPQVAFGGVGAQAVAESDTEIVATSPPEQPGQPTVDITVACYGSVSAVVPDDEFTYLPPASPGSPAPPVSPTPSTTPPVSP